MNAQFDIQWRSQNQQLLLAEFARLRALLGDDDLQQAEEQISHCRQQLLADAAIDSLTELFALSSFERDLLLLVAAFELDAPIADLCKRASNESAQSGVTFGLALALFGDSHWSAIAPVSALRRWRLLELDGSHGLSSARLRIEERVLHFIAGLNYLDQRLQPYFQPVEQSPAPLAPEHAAIVEGLVSRLDGSDHNMPAVFLSGDDRDGQIDIAIQVAVAIGATLHEVHTRDLPASLPEQEALLELWHREAALLGSGLVIIDDTEAEAHGRSFVARSQGLVFVLGASNEQASPDTCHCVINKPDAPSQYKLWHALLAEDPAIEQLDLANLANQYRLSARRMARYVTQASGVEGRLDSAQLLRLCRSNTQPMHALAQEIECKSEWSDLVLPDSQIRTLKQLVSHTRHRMTVHHEWGFAAKTSRGLGIATLFCGESGTGKTLAAEVIAHALELPLYRIDLSAVVSKYIGETEKNLRKLFDAAEDSGAVLLFDEADALFGKRSDVKDSHDRYANIEVSYLLQRMEAYRGLAILTSNHRAALDPAFQRRLRFIVDFPFPDATQRESIWRTIFPQATPVADLDYTRLSRLNVSGGNIRNIALNAAFMAAESGSAVTMPLLQRAAQHEVAKSERTLSTAETRGWA